MWNTETKITPIGIEATGAIAKNTVQAIINVPAEHNLNVFQNSYATNSTHFEKT